MDSGQGEGGLTTCGHSLVLGEAERFTEMLGTMVPAWEGFTI